MCDCRLFTTFRDGCGKGDKVFVKKRSEKIPDHPVDTELRAFTVYSSAGMLWMKLLQSKPEFFLLGLRM